MVKYAIKNDEPPVLKAWLEVDKGDGSLNLMVSEGRVTRSLLNITSDGALYRCGGCKYIPGIQTDDEGRIKLDEA